MASGFSGKSHAVNLPSLPRRATLLTISILVVTALTVVPFVVSELLYRKLHDTAEQAVVLSQVVSLQAPDSRLSSMESQALPLAGIEIKTAEADRSTYIWLVSNPPFGEVVETFELQNVSPLDGLFMISRIFACPPDKLFDIYDTSLPGGENIRAIASYGVFQDAIEKRLTMVLTPILFISIMIALVFPYALKSMVVSTLDDLFIRLYGSAAMGRLDEDVDKDNILASLDNFQNRMEGHVEEQARLASLGAGASFLAHDMRNLLASLQLNADQLKQGASEKERRIGGRLTAAIEKALSLAEWATLYTSQKRQNINVQNQSLQPIVADALNFVRLHDPRREVELINGCADDVTVVAEETLMFRIIYNLALNAVQSMKGSDGVSVLRVEAESDAQGCVISISDNGTGLPNTPVKGVLLMPHMSGFGRPDGMGLGLKIVTDLVSWHGGRIDIVKSDKNGTEFKISLPHATPGAPRDAADPVLPEDIYAQETDDTASLVSPS